MMLFQIYVLITFYLTITLALQINFYTTVGQVKQKVSIKNGYFQSYFPNQEYHSIVP